MFYEIQASLAQVASLKPIHDEEAAANYLVFDNNQWLSYDDGKTFKQELSWANSIEIDGSLVWAADTDDDKYSAMSGLVWENVSHPDMLQNSFAATPVTVVQNLGKFIYCP